MEQPNNDNELLDEIEPSVELSPKERRKLEKQKRKEEKLRIKEEERRLLEEFKSRPENEQILTSELLGNPEYGVTSFEEKRSNPVTRYFIKSKLSGLAASLICCVAGIILGTLIMLFLNPTRFTTGLTTFWSAGFSDLIQVIYKASPLIFCGLAVAVCYKCGMFNIGASGQYAMGGFMALYCAWQFNMHWVLCLIMGIIFGAIIGAVPGILKAYFNVNEVISAIMINWIVLYIVRMLINTIPGFFVQTASGTRKVNGLPGELPNWMVSGSTYPLNIAIIFAIITAIIVAIVLAKTTFGYKLKATGFNRNASEYAGVNAKANIILAFVISGAIAGLGGACVYLLPDNIFKGDITTVWQEGFDGISVAFLANNNPIGIIFSGIFIAFLQVCGKGLTPGIGYDSSVANITISIILYISAFSLLIYNLLMKDRKKEDDSAVQPLVTETNTVNSETDSTPVTGDTEVE